MWLSSVECCVFARNTKSTFNEFCKSPVWKFPTQTSSIHPTQKPVDLFEKLIRTSSNPGNTVLDIFAGSGTTAIAAENTNRKCICIEKHEEYFSRAVERITEHNTQTNLLDW